ncbi:hypothetical protein A4S06_08270 [Erysipelotrichaceae bacterium MTC7]|nr:hypothetical protein A4S06_08270 [Erysipelotrichaceae bacterium MTC7]
MTFTHYTTLEGLQNIISSQRWFLSRGDNESMNDQEECMYQGNPEEWKKTFLLCFSATIKENMAMWGLYGIPNNQAIRLQIPRKALFAWLANIKEVESVQFVEGKISYQKTTELPKLQVHDIGYVSDHNIRTRQERILHTQIKDFRNDHHMLTGYIKHVAWEYESEVRLHATFKTIQDATHIALPVNHELLSSIRIMTGPNFTQEKELSQLLMDNGLDVILEPSKFKGLLRYRSLCNSCVYTYQKSN